MRKFYQDISTHDLESRRKIPGIGPRRAEIIVPGVAILMEALREFRLRNSIIRAGLRDEIIADLACAGSAGSYRNSMPINAG